MKRFFMLMILGALVGCDVDNSASATHTYVLEQYDEVTGLRLMPEVDADDYLNMYITFPQMVVLYEEVEECMGMTAPGPTVYFKNFLDWFGFIGGWGFHTQGTIYVNTYEDLTTGRYRDLSTDTETLRHEYIHNILYHNIGEGDSDHSEPFYELCGLGPKLEN